MCVFNVTCMHERFSSLDSLRSVGHGQADEVSAGQREERHDEGEGSVVAEEDGQEVAVLDVTEHQQRDEHHPADHEQREQTRLLSRLRGDRWEEMKGLKAFNDIR